MLLFKFEGYGILNVLGFCVELKLFRVWKEVNLGFRCGCFVLFCWNFDHFYYLGNDIGCVLF
jgi:hypothetical protein